MNLKGIFPPIPTPFENGHFSPKRLIENLARLTETGLAGFVVLGSNGEAPMLNEAEKLEIIRVARKEIPADKPLIVGTGLEATEATKALTMRAAGLGVDAALILPPFYYRNQLHHHALKQHYQAIADASSIPILIYNMPRFTNLNLSVDLITELAQHPNIVGMKDSAGNLAQLIELREKTPDDFQVLSGNDSIFLGGLVHGIEGAILALSNLAPNECVEIWQAAQEHRWQAAQTLVTRLAPVGRVVLSKYGVPGLKAALDETGYWGGDPRLPLLPVDENQRREIRSVLESAGLR